MLSLNDVLTMNSPLSSVVVVATMFCLGAKISNRSFFDVAAEETLDTSADRLSFFHIVGEVQ